MGAHVHTKHYRPNCDRHKASSPSSYYLSLDSYVEYVFTCAVFLFPEDTASMDRMQWSDSKWCTPTRVMRANGFWGQSEKTAAKSVLKVFGYDYKWKPKPFLDRKMKKKVIWNHFCILRSIGRLQSKEMTVQTYWFYSHWLSTAGKSTATHVKHPLMLLLLFLGRPTMQPFKNCFLLIQDGSTPLYMASIPTSQPTRSLYTLS